MNVRNFARFSILFKKILFSLLYPLAVKDIPSINSFTLDSAKLFKYENFATNGNLDFSISASNWVQKLTQWKWISLNFVIPKFGSLTLIYCSFSFFVPYSAIFFLKLFSHFELTCSIFNSSSSFFQMLSRLSCNLSAFSFSSSLIFCFSRATSKVPFFCFKGFESAFQLFPRFSLLLCIFCSLALVLVRLL